MLARLPVIIQVERNGLLDKCAAAQYLQASRAPVSYMAKFWQLVHCVVGETRGILLP